MYNIGENTFNITDGINNNLNFYFSDFDNIFNEKITKHFINLSITRKSIYIYNKRVIK